MVDWISNFFSHSCAFLCNFTKLFQFHRHLVGLREKNSIEMMNVVILLWSTTFQKYFRLEKFLRPCPMGHCWRSSNEISYHSNDGWFKMTDINQFFPLSSSAFTKFHIPYTTGFLFESCGTQIRSIECLGFVFEMFTFYISLFFFFFFF